MQLRGLTNCLIAVCLLAIAPGAMFAGEDRSGSSPEQGAEGDENSQKGDDSETKGEDWELVCSYVVDDPELPDDDPTPESEFDQYEGCMQGGAIPSGDPVPDVEIAASGPNDVYRFIILNANGTEPADLCKFEDSDVIRYSNLTLKNNTQLVAKIRKFHGGAQPAGGSFEFIINDGYTVSFLTNGAQSDAELNNRFRAALWGGPFTLVETPGYFVITKLWKDPRTEEAISAVGYHSEDANLIEGEIALVPVGETGDDTTKCRPPEDL